MWQHMLFGVKPVFLAILMKPVNVLLFIWFLRPSFLVLQEQRKRIPPKLIDVPYTVLHTYNVNNCTFITLPLEILLMIFFFFPEKESKKRLFCFAEGLRWLKISIAF
jgi:hypothetical protein